MPIASGGGGQGNFKTPTAGMRPAVCFACVALGTHTDEYQGEKKNPASKVKFGFELHGPEDVNADGSRIVVWSKDMSLFLSEKSNLRKMLVAWRGRNFTDQELKQFDCANVVGAPCMINMLPAKNEKYMIIDSVAPLMPGMAKPLLGREKLVYDIEHGKSAEFNRLPKYIQETILKSEEAVAGREAWSTAASKANQDFSQELPPDEPGVPF
jgi:hypothetical protein